jgi:hypothetical protein
MLVFVSPAPQAFSKVLGIDRLVSFVVDTVLLHSATDIGKTGPIR